MNENLVWALKQKGVIEILIYLYKNKDARYSDLKNVVNRESTLVRAINILIENGLVIRKVLNEKYRPTQYTLTLKGEKMGKCLYEILESP